MESCSWLLCTQELPLELPMALGELHDAEHWQGSDPETLVPVAVAAILGVARI